MERQEILVLFDIVNMFANIDKIRSIESIKLALQNRPSQTLCRECINEGLEICLCNNSSKLDRDHLLQTNGTAIGAPNSCSYFDLAVYRLDKLINKEQINNFSEILWKI